MLKNSDSPQKVIVELCRHFYHQGWVSGTGGGKKKPFSHFLKEFPSESKIKFSLLLPEFTKKEWKKNTFTFWT
jgi:hypothetical protein